MDNGERATGAGAPARSPLSMLQRPLFFILCFLFLLHSPFSIVHCAAQYYTTGTESGSVKWRQIQTDKFTIIYPQEIDSLAQRYAWLFDRSYEAIAAPLRVRLPHLPVVLHPYNVNSNGVVVWAPGRMELLTTSPTSSYAQPWDKQLVLHETRHVAQMQKLHSGFFKWLHYFIGEQSEGLGAGIYYYNWFLEGDAVVSETASSRSGRGRQPDFLMPLKAYALSGQQFSWDTWLSGSYRYNIPNEYPLGYVLTSYAYRQAGKHIFGDMADYVTHHPFHIFPTARGLKKYGGFTERDLFRQSFAHLKQQWEQEDAAKTSDSTLWQLPFAAGETYRSYRSITALDTHLVVAIRTDLARPRRLVTIDTNGHETFLKYIGNVNSSINRQGDLLLWTVFVPHERWEQVTCSVLQSYNLKTKKVQTLTRHTRYFALSTTGGGMAVVENTAQGAHFLVLLNTLTYQPEQRIPAPTGTELKGLTWSEDAKTVYAAALSDEGIGIWSYEVARQQWEQLLPYGNATINRLKKYKDYLLFESAYNGANNIYAFHVPSKKMFRLTDARFGAFQATPSVDHTRLFFSNYTPAGYTVASIRLDESAWKETSFDTPARFEAADALSAQTDFIIDTLHIPAQPGYKSSRYSRLAHAFRIHSWAPFYYNPDELRSAAFDKDILQQVTLGATLLSQNSLGTLESRLGYKYSHHFHSGHLSLTYRGWYPVINVNVDVNDRHRQLHRLDTLTPSDGYLHYMSIGMNQPSVDGYVRMYIPWRFTTDAWQTTLVPQIEYYFSNDKYRSFSMENKTDYAFLQFIRAGITCSQHLSLAARDIFPRWGFSIRLLYSFPVAATDVFYSNTSMQLSGYAPGFFANHGVLLTVGIQGQQEDAAHYKYSISGALRFPRGYTTYTSQRLVNATLDYTFPIWYPDVNIGWLAYFKRVRMTVFGDYAQVTYNANTQQNLFSVGADLLIDYHAFRLQMPVSTGIRYAQPLTGNARPSVSLLFSIDI